MQGGSFTNHRKIGKIYEEQAVKYLIDQGYLILTVNYHCRFGEIDIVAEAPDKTVVFIEVKARSNTHFGYASEAITSDKCFKLRKTALFYIKKNQLDWNQMYRFDVILFQNNQIEHIENAFY